jgi:hypothetical protein
MGDASKQAVAAQVRGMASDTVVNTDNNVNVCDFMAGSTRKKRVHLHYPVANGLSIFMAIRCERQAQTTQKWQVRKRSHLRNIEQDRIRHIRFFKTIRICLIVFACGASMLFYIVHKV